MSRSTADILDDLRRATAGQARLFHGAALVLYAGCNLPPESALSLHTPELSAMPAMGPPGRKEQPGARTVADLEVALAETASRLFGAAWADARLQSCTIANLAVYSAFGKLGTILAPAASSGGHFSQTRGGTPEVAGLTVVDLPFDSTRQVLDTEGTVRRIMDMRPTLVMLGRSVVLGPDELAPIAEAARAVGARTVYDASHVAGLIAGGVFPNPLEVGIDLMTMSTYKTLGGPPGAIVCGRTPDDGDTFATTVNRAFLANQDAARYPVLLASLLPFRDGGDEPARTVANATGFKRALEAEGLPVLLPGEPARSHQVVVPTGSLDQTLSAMRGLEGASILVGRCPHPGEADGYALRFGTQFATRLGLGAGAMTEAASLIARLLTGGATTARLIDDHARELPRVAKAIRDLLAPVVAGGRISA